METIKYQIIDGGKMLGYGLLAGDTTALVVGFFLINLILLMVVFAGLIRVRQVKWELNRMRTVRQNKILKNPRWRT